MKNLTLEKDVKVLFSICFSISYLFILVKLNYCILAQKLEKTVCAGTGMLCFTKSHKQLFEEKINSL